MRLIKTLFIAAFVALALMYGIAALLKRPSRPDDPQLITGAKAAATDVGRMLSGIVRCAGYFAAVGAMEALANAPDNHTADGVTGALVIPTAARMDAELELVRQRTQMVKEIMAKSPKITEPETNRINERETIEEGKGS